MCVYTGTWWRLALPQVVIPLHLTIVALVCAWAATRTDHPPRDLCAGVAAGWIGWTLFEYVLHRWVLHHTRHPFLRRILWDALHREHHGYRKMHDPSHRAVHPAISLPAILFVVVAVGWTTSGALPLAAVAGWALGYCSYEALHWFFHSREAPDGLAAHFPLRGLWEAHRVHHLRRPASNYGFVTLLWDRALGTFARG